MPSQDPSKAPLDEKSVELVIRIAQGFDLPVVAEQLRRSGIKVERELKRARLLGATVPLHLVDFVEKTPGVSLVRESRSFQLPPFHEDVPQ